MSFKEKLDKAVKSVLGDSADIQWKNLDHKKVYTAIAVLIAVVVLIIVLIVNGVSGGKAKQPENKQEPAAVSENETPVEEEETEENPLEINAHAEVNELVEKYFQGLASGDTELVASTVDVLSDEEKQTIERKKDYIEAYHNIACYTKKGLEENSYVVFASYEMKIYNIETAAPGIMALYVCTADDGSLYIYNDEAPEELTNYVLELAAEEEVAAIISDVDNRYQQLILEDADLGKFAETMLQSQKEETPEAEEPDAPAENEEGETADLEEPVSTVTTDTIRMRAERSTDSSILDVLAVGTSVKVYANYEDGWSKIDYNGTVGYCKTEFLENTEGVATETAEQPAETEQPVQTETPAPEETASESVNKQMQFKETVRIRAERSTDSERVATGYMMELATVLENYSDGWSKIDYNGTIGYCKTEFLREPQ